MSMKELDKKIENLKKWQDKLHAELEHRTKVEQEAEELICQGKMQEAIDLLNTLDDEKFRKMMESEDGEIEPEEEVVVEQDEEPVEENESEEEYSLEPEEKIDDETHQIEELYRLIMEIRVAVRSGQVTCDDVRRELYNMKNG